MDADFRRRWLPKARDPQEVLGWLAKTQQGLGTEVALHWAIIEGENDAPEVLQEIAAAVRRVGLQAKFNLVRYNPHSADQGQEAPAEALQRNFEIVRLAMARPNSRIVPRVGFDVKASCGMFVG